MAHLLHLRSALLLCGLVAAGCTTNDPGPLPKDAGVVVHGMPASPAGTHYTLRVSVPKADKRSGSLHGEGAYVAIGSFTVPQSADSVLLNVAGTAPASFIIPDSLNTNLLEDAIITLDRNDETSDEPGVRFLAGNFTGDDITAKATLTMEGDDAFGESFSAISGEGSLDAPTGNYPADSARGFWFVLYGYNGSGQVISVSPGLSVPLLPINDETEGWSYQAWIAHQDNATTTTYTSLGRFAAPSGPDATGAGPGAGTGTPYPYPGEDFVTGSGARLLNDGKTLVLVSLDPDSVSLTRPFLPLLISPTIDVAAQSRTPFLLQATTRASSVQVTIRR